MAPVVVVSKTFIDIVDDDVRESRHVRSSSVPAGFRMARPRAWLPLPVVAGDNLPKGGIALVPQQQAGGQTTMPMAVITAKATPRPLNCRSSSID